MINTPACRPFLLAATACMMLTAPACNRLVGRHSPLAVPYTTNPPVDMTINERSRKLNSKGLRAMEAGNLHKAENLFREALQTDLNFGPAHNNLGHLYLARHQLYLAAWEFEYAASLMPELIEPIINQGLAYEIGERIDRAADFYQQAYEQLPSHPAAIASLVRARIKQDGDPVEIGFLLDELIMHDGRQEWVEWAKGLRSTKYRNHKFNPSGYPEDLSISELTDSEFTDPAMDDPGPTENSILVPNGPIPIDPIPVDPIPINRIPINRIPIDPINRIPVDEYESYWEQPPLGDVRNPIRLPPTSGRTQTAGHDHRLDAKSPVRQASFETPIESPDKTAP